MRADTDCLSIDDTDENCKHNQRCNYAPVTVLLYGNENRNYVSHWLRAKSEMVLHLKSASSLLNIHRNEFASSLPTSNPCDSRRCEQTRPMTHINSVYRKIASISISSAQPDHYIQLLFRCFRLQITFHLVGCSSILQNTAALDGSIFIAASHFSSRLRSNDWSHWNWFRNCLLLVNGRWWSRRRQPTFVVHLAILTHSPMRAYECYSGAIFRINWSPRPKYTRLSFYISSFAIRGNVLFLISAYFSSLFPCFAFIIAFGQCLFREFVIFSPSCC